MATYNFEEEEQIRTVFREAVKAHAPPPGLQEVLRERLFGQTQPSPPTPDSCVPSVAAGDSPMAGAAARPEGWAARRVARYAAGLAIVGSLLVVLAVSVWRGDVGSRLAFADVQEAIRHVETAIEVVEFPKTPWMNRRILYRRDSNTVREEWPNGEICLRDDREGRQLILNPRKKTVLSQRLARGAGATHVHGMGVSYTPREFLDKLANVEQTATRRLGEREIDGRRLIGFALPRDSFAENARMLSHVWIDPQTRLPVRCELLPEDSSDLPASFRHHALTFTFNRPLDELLFRLSAPDEYQAFAKRDFYSPYLDLLPLPPKDEKLASPTIEPRVGIGPAKFGMSLKRVMDLLGEPDDAGYFREPTDEERKQLEDVRRKASQEADKQGLKDADKHAFVNKAMQPLCERISKRPPSGMTLDYISRGFDLVVENDRGLVRIFCYGENAGKRPFTGKTSKGIGIGATMHQIENAYGPSPFKSEPSRDAPHDSAIYYERLKMLLDLREGRLWCLSLDNP